MPDKEVQVGPHRETPTGSFTGAHALDRIERERAEKAIEEGKRKAEAGKEVEEEKDERDKEIDKLLPAKITSSIGPMAFDSFKKWYSSIWDQVVSKEHLARGFCTMTRDISGISVVFRTFRSKEMRIINSFSPVSNPDSNFGKYLEEDAAYRAIQIVFGITEFDGKTVPQIGFPTGDLQAWREGADLKARLDWVDTLPEEMVSVMNAILADVTIAYRLALRENLKNQLAPL